MSKARSPTISRQTKRSDIDKGLAFAWYGSKQLKVIYTILHKIGDDKASNFAEFLHFYIIINEIIKTNKSKPGKTISNLSERVNNVQNF